ncbi:MAG: DUF6597 domain-containing transcriptional factor [Candidatus Polarisedimenticolia bacterium]
MRYAEIAPHPSLRPHVERIWILQGAGSDAGDSEQVLPDGRSELIFHLGDPFLRLDGPSGPQPQSPVLAAGQIRGPLPLKPSGVVDVVGVRLSPAGGRTLLDAPASELAGLTIDLESLWGGEAHELLARMQDTPRDDGRVDLLEHSLMRRLGTSRRRDAGIEWAVAEIEAACGRVDLAELARTLGRSRRQLERRFAAQVGLSPRTFARIIRFRRAVGAVRALPAGEPPAWVDVALSCGYFDQSHMIRDFREFAGVPPRAFVRQPRSLSDLMSHSSKTDSPGPRV